MRRAPSGQRNDPVVEPLAPLAERVLLALVRAGDESVCRDRDVTPELAHGLSSVVVASGAGADARHVRAVDVDRDRGLVGGVVHAVDVPRRREAADVADVVVALADHVEVGVEQLLVLDALDDAEDAPGDVVVDPGDLAGPPDQGDDRERAVGLDVQVVGAVARRVSRAAARRSARPGWAGAGAAGRRRAARSRPSRHGGRRRCGYRRRVGSAGWRGGSGSRSCLSACAPPAHTSNANFRADS